MHQVALVFLGIAVIIVAARLLGRLALAVGQPPVVGEIAAGIALGPSLLGLLPGDLDGKLFPPDVLPHLNTLAQLGLVLFMFIVGLELDIALIKGRGRTAGTISVSAVILPFALACGLALILHGNHSVVGGEQVPRLALMLFLGVAMAITAFPVLARILADRRMHRTPLGVLALACAAVDDILAWTLLAFVVAMVKGNGPGEVLRIVALTALFAAVMFGLVRPLLARLTRWHQRAGRLTPDILALVLVGVLGSAFVTDLIGIHAIFGAFIFGAIMPRKDAAQLTHEILERLEQVSVLLLLPLFFVVTGLQTDVGGIGLDGLGELGLILLVAIGGKYAGVYLAGRAMGVPGRQASAIGVLMNTRGLTELVILQIGRELGVLDDQLFTLLVLMALITTALTGPLLRLVYPDRLVQRDIAAADRAALGIESAYRVVVVVDDQGAQRQMLQLAEALLGRRQPSQLVLARMIERPKAALEVGSGILPDLAAMATIVDELNELAAGERSRGVAVTVVGRFTSDPWAEVAQVATNAAASVVLVERAWFDAVGGQLPEQLAPFTVVIAERVGADRPATARQVVAVADQSADGRAAALLAASCAASSQGPLTLVATGRAGSRLSTALRKVAEAGVQLQAVDSLEGVDPSSVGVVVVAGSVGLVGSALGADDQDSPVPVLVVHAGQEAADAELSDEIAALVDSAGPDQSRAAADS